MQQCKDCKHAAWQHTATGRIKRGSVGICSAPAPDFEAIMPASFERVRTFRMRVHTRDGEHCPTYQQKEASK